jgi:prefoldin subunit 5
VNVPEWAIINIGLVFSAFVSVRVAIAVLKVKVDTLQNNVNDLGQKVREVEQKQGEKTCHTNLQSCTSETNTRAA